VISPTIHQTASEIPGNDDEFAGDFCAHEKTMAIKPAT